MSTRSEASLTEQESMAYLLACPSLPPSFICFICFFSLCVARAQESLLPGALSSRSPHGLAYQAPTVVLSPAAFEFFHPAFSPSAAGNGAESPGGAPPPVASAQDVAAGARGSTVHEKVWPTRKGGGGGRAEAGRAAAAMLGAVSAVLLASGVYCVLSRRRARAHKTSATLLVV